MSQLIFILKDGSQQSTSGSAQAKLLTVAIKHKIPIRFGCASCRCGTCGIKIDNPEGLMPMGEDEKALLDRMQLDTSSGTIRLACRSRLSGLKDLQVDLAFQDEYDPDGGSNGGML